MKPDQARAIIAIADKIRHQSSADFNPQSAQLIQHLFSHKSDVIYQLVQLSLQQQQDLLDIKSVNNELQRQLQQFEDVKQERVWFRWLEKSS
ncbi:hypothetical protein [Motilimonas cestriensis]|uniref:hypothetical protein n=1 Tax=Motilimonas cestriensis TaxID=2742685 RepID=UPI003DA24AB4